MERFNYAFYDLKCKTEEAARMSKAAGDYRTQYLELRKMLRDYSRKTGVVFTNEINKAIGLK